MTQQGCTALFKFTAQKLVATLQAEVASYASTQAIGLAQRLAMRFGIDIDPDYLRIGADALQVVSLWKAARSQRKAAGAGCFVAGTKVATPFGTTPIERVDVGDRVLTGVRPSTEFGAPPAVSSESSDIDPSQYRLITLRMPDSTDPAKPYEMKLLEPLSWISQYRAAPGAWIGLSLPELGVSGNAQVLSIDACPTIEAGEGRVVMGTFTHVSRDVLSLRLDGQANPIEVTSGHKFWSLDRADWVAGGALRTGERLISKTGQSVTVESIIAIPGAIRTYNLDVQVDHRYFVADAAVMVHNADPCPIPSRSIVERIKDFATNPSKWKLTDSRSDPSTNIRNPGGSSLQEMFTNAETGEELVRHTIFRANGSIFEKPHFRPNWKD